LTERRAESARRSPSSRSESTSRWLCATIESARFAAASVIESARASAASPMDSAWASAAAPIESSVLESKWRPEIVYHVIREQKRDAHISGLKGCAPKLLKSRSGVSNVNAGEDARGKVPLLDADSSGSAVLVEGCNEAATFQPAGHGRITHLGLQLHRGDPFRGFPHEDDAAHVSQPLAVEAERNESQWERNRPAALHHMLDVSHPLPGQGDADHPNREYCQCPEPDS